MLHVARVAAYLLYMFTVLPPVPVTLQSLFCYVYIVHIMPVVFARQVNGNTFL